MERIDPGNVNDSARNVSAKVSSICCRCTVPRHLPVLPFSFRLLGKLLLLAISRTRADAFHEQLMLSLSSRHAAPISPCSAQRDPFQPIIRHLDSLPSPERTSEIASGTVPDRIFAASPEISPSGRVPRYKYLFSRREQRLSNFAWIRFVFESDILKRGNFSSDLGIWGFFFFNARFSIYKYFLQ